MHVYSEIPAGFQRDSSEIPARFQRDSSEIPAGFHRNPPNLHKLLIVFPVDINRRIENHKIKLITFFYAN
jgi:hypothetical protein